MCTREWMLQSLVGLCCLLITVQAFAVVNIEVKPDLCDKSMWGEDPSLCDLCRDMQDAPDYYCDCHMASNFYYGLDTVISDTTWFTVPIKDARTYGLTAYWFSETSVTIEFYLQCVQTLPYQKAVVGANRSYMMSPAMLDQMITNAGASELVEGRNAYLRIYPKNGKSGRVKGLRYKEGFHSTCDTLYAVYFNMIYPFTYKDNIYELRAKDMKKDFFVQWQRDKKSQLDMAITWGTCMGDTVATAQLYEPSKVYFLEKHLLDSARATSQSLFLHCNTTGDGVLTFVNPVHWVADSVSYELCEGMTVDLKDTLLTETTIYTDTAWLVGDTCIRRIYDVRITPVTPKDTTLILKKSDLPHRFNGWYPIRNFNVLDFVITEEYEDACTEVWNVHLIEEMETNVNILSPTRYGLTTAYTQQGKSILLQIPEAGQLQVLDMVGRVVLAETVVDKEKELENLPIGNYIVRLLTCNMVYTQRIIVTY